MNSGVYCVLSLSTFALTPFCFSPKLKKRRRRRKRRKKKNLKNTNYLEGRVSGMALVLPSTYSSARLRRRKLPV